MPFVRLSQHARRGAIAVAVAGLLGACSDDAPVVVVHVAARPAVAGVTDLTVALTNGSSTQTETFGVAGRQFPLSFSVQVPGREGDLVLDLVARDAAGLTRAAAALTVPLGEPRVDAQVTLEPDDFVVNTTFVGSQDLAFRIDGGARQLTVDAGGVFTIGWSDTCEMVGRCDVFGRRFDATGTPVDTSIAAGDGQFNLNQSDGETGYEPSMVTNRTGEMLAAWATGGDLFAVVVDRVGAHVTSSETVVTTATSPGTPAVTAFPDGRFAVAWTDNAVTAGQQAVMVRYLSSSGTPITNPVTSSAGPFQASTTAYTTDQAPALAALGNASSLAVAWRDGTTLRGRFYGVTGTALGTADVVLATHPAGELIGPPQLATLDGDLLLLYRRATIGGAADAGQLILRRVTAAGAGIGMPVVVTDDVEQGPAALAVSGGDVGIAWSACATDTDGDGCGIRFRRYDANLTPVGAAIPVNTTTTGDQEDPSLGWLVDGAVAVAWTDPSAADPDRDGSAVRARIIYP